jgi:hypothetical protein
VLFGMWMYVKSKIVVPWENFSSSSSSSSFLFFFAIDALQADFCGWFQLCSHSVFAQTLKWYEARDDVLRVNI